MPLPWDTLPRASRQNSSIPAESLAPTIAFDSQQNKASEHHELVVVGAGLAGCWSARILAEQGIDVVIVDQHSEAAGGASGNPAGIVKPYVTRAPCLAMTFHVLAHSNLLQQLERRALTYDAGFHACGVLQLTQRAYPATSAYQRLDSAAATARLGLPVSGHAIEFENSGWLNPGALCKSLLDHQLIQKRFGEPVRSLDRASGHGYERWKLTLSEHSAIRARHVILACGDACNLLPEAQHLPLIPARGQISRFALMPKMQPPKAVINGKHYVIPADESVWVGATFDKHWTDDKVNDHDHALNLAGLRSMIPELHVDATPLEGSAGIRATTPDRLPLVGPMPDFTRASQHYADLRHGRVNTQYPTLPVIDGLYIIGGLGSRGIVTAPLCAHLLAGIVTGSKEGIGAWEEWAPLINPARFLIRHLKRGVNH